jgi:hypothetical protein
LVEETGVRGENLPLMGVRVMVFNATFRNISVILWRSVLLVKESDVRYKRFVTKDIDITNIVLKRR